MVSICISVGHSISSEGALSQCAIGEHEVNLHQAKILQTLLEPDFKVTLYDPAQEDLKLEGNQAEGHDIFMAIHNNSFDKARNYSTVCVHKNYSTPQAPHVKLASKIAMAMAKSMNINYYNGPVYPAGVMPADLAVLKAAHKSGCKYVMLTEAFFIDYHVNLDTILNCSNLAMAAAAEVLRNEFLPVKRFKK